MNQIIITSLKKKYKSIFKFQLIISIIGIIGIWMYFFIDNEDEFENFSHIMDKNLDILSIYSNNEVNVQDSVYLGRIYIEKIDLEYTVFREFNEDLLKIAPCKFYGVDIGEQGNICIAGHNYNDDRFFGRIGELKNGDKIILKDLRDNEYEYIVYDSFETAEDDKEKVLKKNMAYELTLVTCNNVNNKRYIVKAYIKLI